uniref:uncharacterized protein LOC122585271 n=1 Tax=Erigeron canadensis TaxID=72917 RepID=UPI001CB8FBB1|nr:uncharacterized protein LOC122585271 [Erigeron canadensis]
MMKKKEGVMLRAALAVSEKQIWVGFEEKPLPEQEEMLQYLYMNWQDLQQDSSVIEALKDTKFVTGADGDLHKPKHLFDPCDELLTSIFSGEVHKFPGEKFVLDGGWLNILRKTGLQNTSDAAIVLECARRVEFLGAESMKYAGGDFSETTTEVSAQVWSLAETLISVVFERFDFLYSHNFCSIFGKIACIPAEFGFPFESEKKGVKRVLCSYSEAILLKDWPLAWTIAPILTRESLVPPEYSWGALQLTSPPPFTNVLEHLKVKVWHTVSILLFSEEACYGVLSYLDTIWDTLSSSDISELRDIAFIPVCNMTQLVNCSSLFYHLKIDLRPLASEIPLRFLPFVRILKELGLYETLSISSAMMLLSILKNSCRHHPLGPNELRAVIELLHFLYNEITERQNPDRSDWESLLVVPDDSCRLAHPNSCVYIDAYGSWYVKHIDTSKLRFVHRDISERLCLTFGIRKLSDVVVEELDQAAHFQTLDGIWSIVLAAIRKKLLNRSFQVAVSSVLNSVFSSTSGSNAPSFQSVQRSLESVAQRLQFVQCIYTRFWLLPKSLDITCPSKKILIPEWGSRSSHCALYYVDRSKTCMLISEPPSYVSVLDLVALVVSQVLGSPVPLLIGSLFLCPQDSETALVDILRLSFDERVMDGVVPGTSFIGRDILPQDDMQVHLTLLRPYHKGEIVAWQGQKEEKLKYGRIPEDVRAPAGQALYRLNLETAPGKYESIISSRIFWFGNFSIGRRSSTHLMPQDDTCFGSGRVKLSNQRQEIIELGNDSVLDEEFAQAVEEMLCGAGVGLDMEMECLIQTTLSLQEKLKESQAALLLEQEKSEMAAKEAETAKLALLCRICLTNVTDITIVPCGHLLCHRCLSAVSHCPFCRIQLSTTIKIYWS